MIENRSRSQQSVVSSKILSYKIFRSFNPSPATASGNAIVSSMANPFGSSLNTVVWKTHASPSQYSIRWSGAYLAVLNGQHTFSVSAGVSSNVKLFMDNVLLLETGGSDKSATILLDRGVNAMYDVFIEFQVSVYEATERTSLTHPQRSAATSDSISMFVTFIYCCFFTCIV